MKLYSVSLWKSECHRLHRIGRKELREIRANTYEEAVYAAIKIYVIQGNEIIEVVDNSKEIVL